MYISSWQGLGRQEFLQNKSTSVLPYPLNVARKTYFYLARSGIYHLFRGLRSENCNTVLVPAYHHGNEIHAILAAGWQVRFYSINRRLELNLKEIERLCDATTRALFVIHYIGWPQPAEEIAELCRRRNLLFVEDCALSLLSGTKNRPLGSFGDFSIFCLYKTLPVPNGGLVVAQPIAGPLFSQLRLEAPKKLSTIGRCTELILERFKLHNQRMGELVSAAKSRVGDMLTAIRLERTPVGDTGFNASTASLAMSPVCHAILRRLDYDEIRNRRRNNYRVLHDHLEGKAATLFRDLPDGVCPLFYPLLVKDKRHAAAVLRQQGIGAVEFWNDSHPSMNAAAYDDAQFLREHVLELPIHQDLRDEHMEFIATNVLRLGKNLKPTPEPLKN